MCNYAKCIILFLTDVRSSVGGCSALKGSYILQSNTLLARKSVSQIYTTGGSSFKTHAKLQ